MDVAPTPLPSPRLALWAAPGRWAVFLLSATSIWCLLADFYAPGAMRPVTLYVMLPSMVALLASEALARRTVARQREA